MPNDLLHAAVVTWFYLKLQHSNNKKTSIQITHLVAVDNSNTNKKLRCLLCDNSNPQYVG